MTKHETISHNITYLHVRDNTDRLFELSETHGE